jgi:hypothetical protein
MRPKSLFERADKIVMGTGVSETLSHKYLRMLEKHEYGFRPFEYKNSFYCTNELCIWWEEYYNRHSNRDASQILGMLESGFIVPSIKKKAVATGRGKKLVNFYF